VLLVLVAIAAEGPGAMMTVPWLERLDLQQPQQKQQQQHVTIRVNKIGPAITAILAGRANSYHHAKIPHSLVEIGRSPSITVAFTG